jgi:rod shape-determining protein MreC
MQSWYSKLADSIGSTVQQYLQLISVKEELGLAKIENQELKSQLMVLAEVQAENERLKKLIDLKTEHTNFQFLAAKVTAKDLFSDHFSLFVNKGSADGVEKLMGVISPNGVVGYVIDVEPHSSKLLLVNDSEVSIDATIQRTRTRGVVAGYSMNESRLKYIDRPQEVVAGDIVVTSSDQKMFPVGYPIGKVESVHISPSGVNHFAPMKPSVDIKKLEEVIILKPKGHDKN